MYEGYSPTETRSSPTIMVRVLLVLSGLISGCDQIPDLQQGNTAKASCPVVIVGLPDANAHGLEWNAQAGKSGQASANIDYVVVECIPIRHAGSENTKSFIDYTLAATANISYTIADLNSFRRASRQRNLDAPLIFEAITSSQVVLGSANSSFRIIEGGQGGTASAKIPSLTTEEIQRVRTVRVRWQYGRS